MPFVTTFFKDTALFCWQQYKQKVADEIDVLITWEKLKAFLYWSLGKFEAFVDTIWSIIQKDSQLQLEEVMD